MQRSSNCTQFLRVNGKINSQKVIFCLINFCQSRKKIVCSVYARKCYGNLKSETNTSFSLDCLLTSRDIGSQISGIPLVKKGFDIITSGSDNKKFETCPLCTNNQFIALAVSSCIPLPTQFSISELWCLMTIYE